MKNDKIIRQVKKKQGLSPLQALSLEVFASGETARHVD